jgi:hypothetical protein
MVMVQYYKFDFLRDGSSLEAARAILKALVIVTPQEDLLDFHQVLLRRTTCTSLVCKSVIIFL